MRADGWRGRSEYPAPGEESKKGGRPIAPDGWPIWLKAKLQPLIVTIEKTSPGIQFSARYAGVGVGDQENNAKLLRELAGVEDDKRSARFRCVMVYVRDAEDTDPIVADAAWEGRILRKTRGKNGFGYDPLFFVPEQGCASAELPPEVKNRLSHRGQALRVLARNLHFGKD